MLTVRDIAKSFGDKQALDGVSFTINPGEIMAVLGPSGCGKSTLLHIIAGLESAGRGEVAWQGVSLAGVPPYRRNFGLMFQDFALFPHQNVFDNVAFGPRMQRIPAETVANEVRQVLTLVGLPGYEPRDVNTLSGGEQQRVALARALAPHPRLLMLDEPLGALDRTLRERLVLELHAILRRTKQTALYVTHDQEEAFTIADRLVVMNAGRVEQIGAPQDVYCRPASLFVARFLGMNNLFPATVLSSRQDSYRVDTPFGQFELDGAGFQAGQAVTVLLRPDAVQVGQDASCSLAGMLTEAVFRGGFTRATFTANGYILSLDFPSLSPLPPVGQELWISFDPVKALQVFY
jgi:ABC-type Fe3+/spermidine/putrescine transport system ATPase subunit